MNDMAYATGAEPDYNPQMAESIAVYSNEAIVARLLGRPGESGLDRLAWTILWTDTEGVRHGRIWAHARKFVETVGVGKGVDGAAFPLAIASTQAGCVWVWKKDDQTWAEIQQSHGDHDRYPRIHIQPIVASITDDLLWDQVPMYESDEAPRVWIGEGR